MKKDLDFVREILIKGEEISGEGAKPASQLEFSTDSEDKLGYHLYLLKDAGFINAGVRSNAKGTYKPVNIVSLTNEGHKFLDNIRNDTVWAKVKSKAKDKMSSVSLKVLASLAEDLIKNSI